MSDNTSTSSVAQGPQTTDDDTVTHTARPEAGGGSSVATVLTPHTDERCKEVLCDPRPPIPVIFLPGVMGTLLVNKETGDTVWYPPNTDRFLSTFGAVSIVSGWFAKAASREKRFDPTIATVNPNGPVDVAGCEVTEEEARRRGWGALHRTSYSQALAWLDHQLNHPMMSGEPVGAWHSGDPDGKAFTFKALLGTDPAAFGASGSGTAIDAGSDEFKHFSRYRFPVYAIGYNWLQSNLDSGKDALNGSNFVDPKTKKVTRIMGIKEICIENKVDKAIIVTHSMGGLVARMASQLLDGANSIYGVIHGVQPATGAPLAAKRFRTGGEGFVNQSLMGRNDAEFMAVSANAPGPLELTPMPDYHNGEPWWIFQDAKGHVRMALPKESALEELYLNSAWYGLLPDPSVLDPAGIVSKRLETSSRRTTVQDNFKKTMSDVVDRQNQLINNYHPNTYAFYANGALASPTKSDGEVGRQNGKPTIEKGESEKTLLTWGNVVWQGDIPPNASDAELKAAKLSHDDHQGVIRVALHEGSVPFTMTVQREAVRPDNGRDNGIIPGDGTVPIWSADAQGRGLKPAVPGEKANGVQTVFTQGGYVHQFCYVHPWARWATLYSILKIAKSIEVPTP